MANVVQLEKQKQILLSQLDGWSVAQMAHSPAPGEWSAVQVLDHLVKTEEEILLLAKEGVRKPHRIGARDRLGFAFILKVFGTDRKFKTPGSATQIAPSSSPSLEQVLERWSKTRSDFLLFESGLSRDQMTLGLFRHPVAGWMGIQQMRSFFSVHMIHHRFQIERLRSHTVNL